MSSLDDAIKEVKELREFDEAMAQGPTIKDFVKSIEASIKEYAAGKCLASKQELNIPIGNNNLIHITMEVIKDK